MKTILNTLLIALANLLLLQGCTNQLDEENINEPTADTYYNTATGFSDLINACYTQTRSQMNGGGLAPMLYGTDLWTSASDVEANEFNTYSPALQASNNILYNLWEGYYIGISACNTAISRASGVNGLTESELNAKLGEAYFLRAWYYHILVMHFGDLPMPLEEIKEVTTTATRIPQSQVYDQIVADLLKAADLLPPTQSDWGRAAKPAAEALLARVYLTLGRDEDAAAYAMKVIDGYGFDLVQDYAELWDPNIPTNMETIWSIQFSQNNRLNGPNTSIYLYFTPRYDLQPGMTRSLIYDRPYPRYMATRFYLDLMQANRDNDSRYDKSWRDTYLANYTPTLPQGMNIGDTAFVILPYAVPDEYKASKPYKVMDIRDYYDGENPVGALQIYPKLNKWNDPNRESINANSGTRSVIEIRLAEMYLIAAEALMKLNRSAEGVKYINRVRERAAWPGKEEQMKITASQLDLDFILNERALELGGERLRWADLKRTGKLIERVKLYNPAGRNNIREKFLLRPIPSNMIDRLTNKDEFPQNPEF
ncbi:RagB/SusD family nutrient uptake outer membrane protein [Parapedobacter lycopersici]|uniref:RagB/SusD family nutrient uptake outer membrane protein n=1 Tax=Parapedobacter lycopersici TaxID=1864939 RepID=UPI00214DBA28|nr:RagB/SusD family nutrient uptake outer membrane protein [Parapedobacter lycopersici]